MGRVPLLLLLLSALSLSEGRGTFRCELRDEIAEYYDMPLEYVPKEYMRMLARVVCEVERRAFNASSELDEEEGSSDFSTDSPTTDLPGPPASTARARKRRQLQTTADARPSTSDVTGPPSFSATAVFESEWKHFGKPVDWRRRQSRQRGRHNRWRQQRHRQRWRQQGWRKQRRTHHRRQQRRWGRKPGRPQTPYPPHIVFPTGHPVHPATTDPNSSRPSHPPTSGPNSSRPSHPPTSGPNSSRPSHPPTSGPNSSRPNPPTTTDDSAGPTAVRRKRDLQQAKLFGVYPVYCSDDFVDGDISSEVECFAESGVIEIVYWEAGGSCKSEDNLDAFFEGCDDEEEGSGEEAYE